MEHLNEIFNIDSVEQPKDVVIVPVSKPKPPEDPIDSTLVPDFVTAKDNIDVIMEMGKAALEKVLEIAQEGQHPRFYEAAAILIKNLSDANKDYLDVHEKISRIRRNNDAIGNNQNAPAGAKINIEQAVFTGTAAELLQQVKPRIIESVAVETKANDIK